MLFNLNHKKKIFISFLLTFFFIFVNLGWGVYKKEVYNKGGLLLTSKGIEESKEKRCFVEKLNIFPENLEVNGKKLHINEVWLEKQHNLFFVISIIPTIIEFNMYTKRNEFQLVFNLVENEIGDDLFGWFFVSENKKHAFGKNHLGDVIIFRLMIKQNDWEIFQIYFTKTWSFENKKVLKILRET